MQVRPWGPSITPQAYHFKGNSNVEATKSKYESLFQNLHHDVQTNFLRLQMKILRLQMKEIVLLFIQWNGITNS
jgi:hypothetical protein